ncbi:hypothetical protein ACIPZ5_01690 [Pseudomonas sp. NPDC089428]|uniref:hypothetical protein n=1 Tax=Pseudomonas sp. NPDC089428 TaxID=3364467 RepID=UPI0038044A74
MLNFIQYRIDLHRQARAALKHELNRPSGTQAAYESGQLEEFYRQADRLHEWRMIILTSYLRSVADDLIVPMPPLDDRTMYAQVDWDDDPRQPKYLTEKGIQTVRTAIREEQKHRREAWTFRLTTLTGLGGIAIGILSAWPK